MKKIKIYEREFEVEDSYALPDMWLWLDAPPIRRLRPGFKGIEDHSPEDFLFEYHPDKYCPESLSEQQLISRFVTRIRDLKAHVGATRTCLRWDITDEPMCLYQKAVSELGKTEVLLEKIVKTFIEG